MLLRPIFLLITLLTFVPLTVSAQTSGAVTGRVFGAQGALEADATVSLTHVATGQTRSTRTENDGRYTFAAVAPGAYEVVVARPGFRTASQAVTVTIGETAVVDLIAGYGLTEDVVVTQPPQPVVNTRSGELSYLVESHAIEELPLNGRNYTDLALLQPAVIAFPHRDGGSVVAHGLGMSVNGQDPRSNVYLLDGTLLNDMTNGPAGSAAGTALGMESVQEFRVETNAYSAEFGRMSGGQVNVLTKAGSNNVRGSAYEFHRNDALDAKNYFDVAGKPPFTRNQFGGAAGGPLRRDRLFYFVGYESLHENLGKTITPTVPDENAHRGLIPDPAQPGTLLNVGVSPGIAPYLNEYPLPNGRNLGDGTALYSFRFDQTLRQHFAQGRIDYNFETGNQLFGRYTLDDAAQRLPTDFPQFPRSFVSRNQFFTGEYRHILSPAMLSTYRVGYSRTRVGQSVEANTATPLAPFVPGRSFVGNIDIGGLNRFGTQSSVDVRFLQQVLGLQYDSTIVSGRSLLKFGAIGERYLQDMVNPTFSLGTYSFANLRAFLENRATSFIGLTPQGEFDRYWRFWIGGGYLQEEFQVSSRLTLTGGVRYEFMTMPSDINGRDSALPNLADRTAATGRLYESADYNNLSPRVGGAWNVTGDGRTSVRGAYGLYFNTNGSQNLIVTVTNPPATPRVVFPNPTFPNPPFDRASGLSIRPIQWDIETPRLQVWNVSLQRELWGDIAATIGYAAARGSHLLRSNDVNTATPTTGSDGRPFFPVAAPRQNTAWTTIELKSSDGESWYDALIVEVRRRFAQGFMMQSSYTWSKSEDTTQASTFFSDATNGTTSAFPEYIADYNKGLSDFHAAHNWVTNFSYDLPWGRNRSGMSGAVLAGWRVSGIINMRSGSPLTVFVQNNRSRSQWQPSLGPGIGRDRPSYAAGFGPDNAVTGDPNAWFNPAAFVLQPAGTFGNTGRGDFIGPNLRTVDISLVKDTPWTRLGNAGRVEVRLEIFNLFNRANFGPPQLIAFAGAADNEGPLASFGRVRNTITSARQAQLGLRIRF
jgi:hypothetical protein